MRLDAFIAQRLGVSRSRAVKIVEGASLNGKPCKPKNTLNLGDQIAGVDPLAGSETALGISAQPLGEMPEILFEDADIMVIRKARGVTVHAGSGDTSITLVETLQSHGYVLSSVGPPERAGIVHRLDRDTSGVMLVCKTDAAHWKLAADFESRDVKKTYQAVCCGVPPQRGRIEAPIARSLSNRTKMTISPAGRFATTEYEVERHWERFALLKINLLTGRTHQIRVHFAYLNFPIAGDVVYSGYFRAIENAPDEDSKLALEELHGQALHAQRIEFNHPITREPMSFSAPPPHEIQRIIDALDAAKANEIAIEAAPKPRHLPFGHES